MQSLPERLQLFLPLLLQLLQLLPLLLLPLQLVQQELHQCLREPLQLVQQELHQCLREPLQLGLQELHQCLREPLQLAQHQHCQEALPLQHLPRRQHLRNCSLHAPLLRLHLLQAHMLLAHLLLPQLLLPHLVEPHHQEQGGSLLTQSSQQLLSFTQLNHQAQFLLSHQGKERLAGSQWRSMATRLQSEGMTSIEDCHQHLLRCPYCHGSAPPPGGHSFQASQSSTHQTFQCRTVLARHLQSNTELVRHSRGIL
jgi:hypothetical protein